MRVFAYTICEGKKKKKTYKLWNKLLILKYASGSKTFTTLQ